MARSAGACHGVLVIDKPAGPSSHDVVAWVRRVLGERRVGHCGTLDPAATGVLVVCVGEATKLVAWIVDDDKQYAATIGLGRATTTADAEGETIATADVSDDAFARAIAEIPALCGALELAPPKVSAVRVDGVRAHALVRAGTPFELPRRTMLVHTARVDATDPELRNITTTFDVGKGTYIRALATELGERVGVPAHLVTLRRTRAGRFALDATESVGPLVVVGAGVRPDGKPRHRLAAADGTQGEPLRERVLAALLPVQDAAPPSWPRLHVPDADAFARLCNGVQLDRARALPAAGGDAPFAAIALVGGPSPAASWVVARLTPGPDARVETLRVLHPQALPAHEQAPAAPA